MMAMMIPGPLEVPPVLIVKVNQGAEDEGDTKVSLQHWAPLSGE